MKSKLTDILGITLPLIQGPMSWLTDARFVAAVSNAGGLGILGPNAGQHEIVNDPIETAERMRSEIQKVKNLTNNPFAVTLIGGQGDATSDFTLKILDVVIEEKVPVVLINSIGLLSNGSYGVEPQLLKSVKENGIKMIVRSWQPSVADAKAVEAQGAAAYVVTGFDEGGTLPEQITGSYSIVPYISDAVNIPVVLAGGVSDVRTVRAAIALGAAGVYVGSRLIPTVENPAAQVTKELIVNSTAEDLKIFRVAPAFYRSLPTKLRDQLVENDQQLSKESVWQANGALMNGTSGMRIGMLDGDFDNGYVSVGTGISTIHSIQPVAEVIDDMMIDFK